MRTETTVSATSPYPSDESLMGERDSLRDGHRRRGRTLRLTSSAARRVLLPALATKSRTPVPATVLSGSSRNDEQLAPPGLGRGVDEAGSRQHRDRLGGIQGAASLQVSGVREDGCLERVVRG